MNVSYRSDTCKDHRLLEDFLSAGGFDVLPDADLHTAMLDSTKLEAVFQRIMHSAPYLNIFGNNGVLPPSIELPTRYDSPVLFNILHPIIEEIKSACKSFEIDTKNFPHYANIPTREVNACAINIPGASKEFLLFDSQIFYFCHLFSKIFSSALPTRFKDGYYQASLKPEKIKKQLQRTPEPVFRLVDLLDSYCSKGAPSAAKPYLPKEKFLPLGSRILDGMEYFLVGHEFGHVYAGHLSSITKLTVLCNDSTTTEHKIEYEADAIGLTLSVAAMTKKGNDAAISFIGAYLFFSSLELVERFRYLKNKKTMLGYAPSASTSHPSNPDRQNALIEYLKRSPVFYPYAAQCEEMSHKYKEALNIIWDRTEKLVVAAIK